MTETTRPCRYLDETDTGQVPTIEVLIEAGNSLCLSILETVSATLVVTAVSHRGCAIQREEGCCPRGFGAEVDPNLQPNALAKAHH
jgi:hypothetical protein